MINSVSMDTSLAATATNLKSSSVQNEISVAIMKQVQNQQEVFADALLSMITQGPMPDGTGQLLNIGA
jgi:hypothetical protein